MKRAFSVRVWQEDDVYVSQCLDVDVASQGDNEQKAVENLQEALTLYFSEPRATRPAATLHTVEIEIGAA